MSEDLPDDLESRIFQLLDGELSESAAKQLDQELQNSAEARKLYLKTAALHSALQMHHQSQTELSKMPIISAKRLLEYQQKRIVKLSLAAAAVFILSTMLWWAQIASKPPRALASFEHSPNSEYTLTHAKDSDAITGNVMRVGSKLNLSSGMIEAKFTSGARCVIEAPSELVVLADDRISLKGGVSRFEVPPKAVGFTVETPKLKIVDLGTEFGVIASLNAQPEVHVITGSIELGLRDKKKNDQLVVLKAGQARKLDTKGDLQVTPYNSKRFSTLSLNPLSIRNSGFDKSDHVDENQDERGYGEISHWATSGSGIGRSHIDQPFLNQPAKSGEYAAFIQGKGSISQTVSGFDSSKLYTVTYFVSERGLPNASTSTSVSLDLGASVYAPQHPIIKTDAFRRIVSGPLAVFGPTANIQISAKTLTGDASLLVDSVSISRAVPAIPNGGFEHPALSPKEFIQAYNDDKGSLESSSWSFANGAGVQHNDSAFATHKAPEGSQTAVFQSTDASFETKLQGFEAGVSYRLVLNAAGRNLGAAALRISIDDIPLRFRESETLTPDNKKFESYKSDTFKTEGGDHTLKIESISEGCTFVDDLYFEFVSESE